jgi:hypothetical protein
MDLTDLEVNF